MGSSGSESVDFAVGSIVWVRRRNGSWWPGKILGPHDLSNSHLMSPRSGTPVKLLGREDASVDWYNLEKSKRVKAFRCGDFDECIERAESSVGIPPKKREKYARREDAILHALELEKQILDNQVWRLDIASDTKTSKSSISGEKGSVTSSGNRELDDLNGPLERMSEGICVSPGHGNSFHPANKTNGTMVQEDEAPPKMRDLQEFGLRTIPSKRKFSSSVKADETERPDSRFQAHVTSGGGYIIERDNRTNFLDDWKISPKSLMEGTSTRGYYRRPPAVQVPQNSANISSFRVNQAESHVDSLNASAPNQIQDAYWAKRNRRMYLPTESNGYLGNISEFSSTLKQASHFHVRESKFPLHASASDYASEFSEDTESDSSVSDDSETDSDEMDAVAGRRDELMDSIEGSEAVGRLGNMSNEELDELALSSETPLFADDGVSKWKLKGKRNVRHMSKGSLHIPNAGVRMNDQTYMETRGNTFNNRASRCVNYQQRSSDFDGYFEGDDSFDGDYWSPGSALGNTRHSAPRHMPRGRRNNNNIHVYDWDGMGMEHRTPLNGYLMETRNYYTSDQPYVSHGHVEGRRRSMLVEVDLKVQSSYPKQHVPLISLKSKLDGRAIVGHLLQIEEIEEGSSDTILPKKSEFDNRRLQGEVNYALPSIWKTARRTASYRVPRPDLSSAVDSGGDAEYLPPGRKLTSRDLYTSVASAMQKFDPYTIHHVQTSKPTRKLSKKGSMSASQKTRTLSSFSVDHHKQRIGQGRHVIQAFSLSELIKFESGCTNVQCIPVKLVFSRLYEAVGRPPASIAAPNHEARVKIKTAGVQQQS